MTKILKRKKNPKLHNVLDTQEKEKANSHDEAQSLARQ